MVSEIAGSNKVGFTITSSDVGSEECEYDECVWVSEEDVVLLRDKLTKYLDKQNAVRESGDIYVHVRGEEI